MTERATPTIRIAPPTNTEDRAWLARLWAEEWGGETMVSRGRLHRLADLDALIAWDGAARVGAATYHLDGGGVELTSINATRPGAGVGSALLTAIEQAAREAGAGRLWLITTNDNLDALRFYQRRGYRLTALHPSAVDEARTLKPGIPPLGNHGIPLRDELELAKEV